MDALVKQCEAAGEAVKAAKAGGDAAAFSGGSAREGAYPENELDAPVSVVQLPAGEILVADAFDANANTQVVSSDAIPDGWMGLDNGPAATKMIQDKLADCKTVIWNGPMGVFEMDAFAKGTFAICDTLKELTEKGAITIIGGGDSVAAVEKAGLADAMSHISTGGGASLELLEGKVLPGVAARDAA